MRVSPFLTAPLFCLLLAACSDPVPQQCPTIVSQFTGLLPQIVENDSGLFQGILLGMTPDEVKKQVAPGDSIGPEENGSLLIEHRFSAKKEYYYECKFDDRGLYEVMLEIHLKDEPHADSLFTDLANYFCKRYGMPLTPDGRTLWVSSEGKRPAKIILEDNSAEYEYGKLTITFFDRSFDPPPTATDSLLADTLLLP